VSHVVTGIRVADPSSWRQQVERWLVPRMDKVVCVSQAVADFCREKYRLPAEKHVVIPNGIDLSRFENVQAADVTTLGVPAGRRAILYVGRLDRQKGLDWLLKEVMADVLSALPQHDLLLVGDGPQRNELEQMSAASGLSPRIHFVGWRPDVPQIMAASDLLVLPSRWEGMPNVVLEAMASRLPIAATQAEGISELLGESALQSTSPAGDAAGFGQRVIQMVQDRELARRLVGQNYARVSGQFSLAGMIRTYESLYESLTGC